MGERISSQKNSTTWTSKAQQVETPLFQTRPFENETSSTSTEVAQTKTSPFNFNFLNLPTHAPAVSGEIQQKEEREDSATENDIGLQMQSGDGTIPQEKPKGLEEDIQTKSISGDRSLQEDPENAPLQTKLTVGKPGDKYEQEADSTAQQVMAMSDSAIQRTESEEIQASPLANTITSLVQRQTDSEEEIQTKQEQKQRKSEALEGTSNLENSLAATKGGGNPLPDDVRNYMEPRFGADFSKVRVHTDSTAMQMNKQLGAQAFAHGGDIYYAAGKSPGKNELTAHELTHTIQQGAAGQRSQSDSDKEQDDTTETTSENKQQKVTTKQENAQQQQPKTDTTAGEAIQDARKAVKEVKPHGAENKQKTGQNNTNTQQKAAQPKTKPEKTAPVKEGAAKHQDNEKHETVGKIHAQQEKVAGKQVEAETAVKQSSAEMEVAASEGGQTANAGVNFDTPPPKPMFATTEEGINALQPEEVLGKAGNNMVLYQTDNPEKAQAVTKAGIPVHPISSDKANNAREQQRAAAQAAISQFMASAGGRKAQIASLGTTIAPRIQSASTQAKASVDRAIAQNQNAIANSIAQTRERVQTQAQSAKSQIMGQHGATVEAIRTSTASARASLQAEYQTSLAQLAETEPTMATRIAEPFNKAAQDFRAAGEKVGAETVQIAAEFTSQYAKESPPEPSNVITKFLESFDRDTYVQNWRKAKIDAAQDLANAYREGLIKDANEKASQLTQNQPQVVQGMQQVVNNTRFSLEVKYNSAVQQLNQSEQQALQTANTTLQSQLQGIDGNLNSILASLQQMQVAQQQQLQATGQQQKQQIDSNAKQATAALQQGVNQASNNLQHAFQKFADQARGAKSPNLQVINEVIAEANGQLNDIIATTRTELSTSIEHSAQGIAQQGQHTAQSLNTIGQQAATSSAAVGQEFSTSMAQVVQSATQAFTQLKTGHTQAVNATAQQVTGEFKKMTAEVGQKLDGVINNLNQKLGSSAGQLEIGLRGSLSNLRSQIPTKAQEAADKVQPAWKSVLKVVIDIVVTVAVTVAIVALAASGVGLVAAIGLAALIGAAGALVKRGANDLIDGKVSSLGDYAKAGGFGAVGGVLQLVGLRGADKLAGLLTSKITQNIVKVGVESLGEAAANITQQLGSGEAFSLAMIGKSIASSLLGNAGGQALAGVFGKLGSKLGLDKIESKALKVSGEFASDTISDTAMDVTSQVAFEGKDLSWATIGESAGTSALGNLTSKGANRAYGDQLRNLGARDTTSPNVSITEPSGRPVGETPVIPPILDAQGRPVGETPTPTRLVDTQGRPIGEPPAPSQLIDAQGRPVGESPQPIQIIDPNTNRAFNAEPQANQLVDKNGDRFFNPSQAEIDAWADGIKEGGNITAGSLVSTPAPTDFRLGQGQQDYWGAEPSTGMTVQEYRFQAERGLPKRDSAGNIIPGSAGDVSTRMRIHSPDSTAPAGSASAKDWTMGFEQGNARMLPDGTWFDTRYQTLPDGTRLDVRPYRQAPDGSWVHKDTGATVTDPKVVSALDRWNRNMADSHIPLFPESPTPATPKSKTSETDSTPPTNTTVPDTPTSSGTNNKVDQENLPNAPKTTQNTEDTTKTTPSKQDTDPTLSAALPRDLQGKIPIHVDPDLPGNTVRVHYEVDANGLVTNIHMRAGAGASAVDIQLHAQTVRLMQQYSGFSGRIRILKEKLQSWITKNGEPPVGSRAWEAKLEVEKLPRIIDERLARLSKSNLDADVRTKLQADIDNLQQQLIRHQKTLDEMDTNSGKGFVAAEYIDPKNIDEARAILDRKIESVRSKLNPEIQNTKAKIHQFEEEISNLDKTYKIKNQQLENRIKNLQVKLKSKNKEAVKNRINELQQELNNLNNEKNQKRLDLQQAITSLKAYSKKLESIIGQIDKDVEFLQEYLVDPDSNISNPNNILSLYKDLIKDAVDANKDLNQIRHDHLDRMSIIAREAIYGKDDFVEIEHDDGHEKQKLFYRHSDQQHYVIDSLGQRIPRYQFRNISDKDDRDIGRNPERQGDIIAQNPDGNATPLQHTQGYEDSPWISITKTKKDIKNPKGESFDKYGKVRVDLLGIDPKFIIDISSEIGRKNHGFPVQPTDEISSIMQATRDVIRTLEVLIKKRIPGKLISRVY